jgi:hypothetical protein
LFDTKRKISEFVQNKVPKKNCQGRVHVDVYTEARMNLAHDGRFKDLGELLESLLKLYNAEMKKK